MMENKQVFGGRSGYFCLQDRVGKSGEAFYYLKHKDKNYMLHLSML